MYSWLHGEKEVSEWMIISTWHSLSIEMAANGGMDLVVIPIITPNLKSNLRHKNYLHTYISSDDGKLFQECCSDLINII